ncbi:diaminopimelate epimerase [Oceanobacillus halophilus]|uniref:Diaminopimelate epimerase n=1 Tax=Oceanobacillus halophilus TaxID=930130 RepID=A0A495A726_9BACI|nr:diaminopimelate epimerase [Oceanobacillus halophilus]RKQ35627.1 diaminopimelate epimerase [Oceanobacillus halophilus]
MMFTKMHGLGNNYILFDELDNSKNELDDKCYSELSRKLSDGNFGIGSDGIIRICPSNKADFKMRIFNEDGSEAKNCGNGLRCVAKFLYDHLYATTQQFTIETLGGVVGVEVDVNNDNQVEYVLVDMGEPKLLKGMIPMKGDPFGVAINESHIIEGKEFHLTCLSMGNPHAIHFVENVNDIPLEEIGPNLEQSPLFPERVNVGIVHVKSRQEMDYRVWERGSGITMACGTGACASVVAATLNEFLDRNEPIVVHLPGGDLTIQWDTHGHVWMRGTAHYICHGEIDRSLLSNIRRKII